jgi:hypothetical protein
MDGLTMKRGFSYFLILFFLFSIVCFSQQSNTPIVKSVVGENDVLPEGWVKSGDQPQDYTAGVERNFGYESGSCGFLVSKEYRPLGFATLQQTIEADNYKEQRVEFSGYVKTNLVAYWSGLFMKVEDIFGRVLAYDDMHDRPIVGTSDWAKFSVVLDVPQNASKIIYGAVLSGKGEIYFDTLNLSVVKADVPLTDLSNKQQPMLYPDNMDFEK